MKVMLVLPVCDVSVSSFPLDSRTEHKTRPVPRPPRSSRSPSMRQVTRGWRWCGATRRRRTSEIVDAMYAGVTPPVSFWWELACSGEHVAARACHILELWKFYYSNFLQGFTNNFWPPEHGYTFMHTVYIHNYNLSRPLTLRMRSVMDDLLEKRQMVFHFQKWNLPGVFLVDLRLQPRWFFPTFFRPAAWSKSGCEDKWVTSFERDATRRNIAAQFRRWCTASEKIRHA